MTTILIYSLVAFIISMVSGFLLIPVIMNFCKRKRLYDIPNERKVHKNAIPRLGGISFMPSMVLAFFLALLVMEHNEGRPAIHISLWACCFLIGLIMIYTIGIIDDLVGLSARTKFIVQIIAATMLPLSGLYINQLYGFLGISDIPFWVGACLTVFLIVFIDNAINLIDGIDGLAAGLSFLALGGFLACFIQYGLLSYCILIAGLMGVLMPYLYFNICGNPDKNRKIFMGDSGSLTLGFILGMLFVKYAMNNPAVMEFRRDGLMLSITMLLVPMFDVVRIVLVRFFHHRPLFLADKNHLHHKWMRAGFGQHATLFIILLTAVFFGFINILMVRYMDISLTYSLTIDIALYVIYNQLLDAYIKSRGEKPFV